MATVRSQALATVRSQALATIRSQAMATVRHARRGLSSAAHRVRAQSESHVDIAEIDKGIYRGPSESLWVPPGGRGVFGGQVIGQALHAATLTVAGTETGARLAHSLHAYFLQPGNPKHDVIYKVRDTSDRRSFASRTVEAVQRGEVIFKMGASFCNARESSPLAHQRPMPDVPPPDGLPTLADVLAGLLRRMPEGPAAKLRETAAKFPLDLRFITEPPDLLDPAPTPRAPRQQLWVRVAQPLGEQRGHHAAAAAYFSDYALLTTAMLPHGVQIGSPRMGAVASLDHSLWFHTADFRADEWLLYDMESPWAACGRGLAFGHLYTQQGKLAISCAQEGVMRLAKPSVKRPVSTAARWFADLVMQANKRWGS
jgi:acyl-CoA thioesterase II